MRAAGWRPFQFLAFCGCFLSMADGVRAGEKPRDPAAAKVHALYESGMAHYNLAEYTEAERDFKEGYRSKPDPAFLFNLGQCERQQHNPEEAEKFYRAYLRGAPNAKNRADVEQFIKDGEAAIAAKQKESTRPPISTVPPQIEPTLTALPEAKSPSPIVAAAPAPQSDANPKARRKWLWPVVGAAIGVVVAGTAIGLGVGLSQGGGAEPGTDLGTFGGIQ